MLKRSKICKYALLNFLFSLLLLWNRFVQAHLVYFFYVAKIKNMNLRTLVINN